MDPFEAIKATFFQECEELLGDVERGLLAMQAGEADGETVNAVFRAVHSVKGGAGAFALDDLVRFAHVFETLLDELRSDRRTCDDEVVRTLLRAADVLADHVQAARGLGPAVDPARSDALAAELHALATGEPTPIASAPQAQGEPDEFGFVPVRLDLGGPPAPVGDWRVVFRPTPALYEKGNDAALLLRELSRLGRAQVSLDAAEVPTLDVLDPHASAVTWTVVMDGAVGEQDIREIFEFVEGDCELTVEREAATVAADDDFDVSALLASLAASPAPREPEAAPAPAPAAAPASDQKASSPAQSAAPPAATIRVDLGRVDRMIDLVGELVIQQSVLSQRVVELGAARGSNLFVSLEELERLTREIQDSVMSIRAQPVRSVFQRMPRLVREVAEATGKRVRLVTDGEGTEVDKTVIERLSDPITHMLRNAIDHGLEVPEQREAAGKPPEGLVRLSALHRSGRIVIEISDDGRGIDRARVRSIAEAKGLIAPDAALTDDEVDNLIFLPGFSTAETVSDISGRGVGMDVVRRSVQALGGRISISSRPGRGSTFTLSLPLTLAVMEGMVLGAAGQTLVAPLASIVESLLPRADQLHGLGDGTVTRFRGEFIPVVDVGAALGFGPASADGVVVVVETEAGEKAGLRVDQIQGQRQVVIKSLETHYRHVEGVAAATILGDGRVALIIDVDALVGRARLGGRTDMAA